MKLSLTNYLIKKANLSSEEVIAAGDIDLRARYGCLEGWVSLVVNLLLFILKIVLGIISGSISIIADAVHTVSDVITSAIVIWGFKISKKPADAEHPFGHGRMEDIAALIIAVLLCVIGFEILQAAFGRISSPTEVKGSWSIIGFLGISVFVKEWLARFSFALSKKIDSSTLFADAWHHRSDALSTLLVIIAVIGAMHKVYKLDDIFGALVALYIIYNGGVLIRKSTFHLLGKAVDEQLKNKIENIAREVEGVEGVHDIVAHDYGNFKAISLHVEVARSLNSIAAHKIATSVEARIAKSIKSSPIVHIDLKKAKRKKTSKDSRYLQRVIKRFKQVISFHAVELLSNESGDFLTLHITISKFMNTKDSHALVHQLQAALSRHFKERKINVHVEPCDSRCVACSQSCKEL